MSSGLLALLDDVVAIAKVAASSVDDVAAQAAKAGSKAISKAAGIVIDDAAVTPRYVVGFAAASELPIVAKIAIGSLKNKIIFLLPGAVALNILVPWAVVPLLMIGGVYLCLEGFEKVLDFFGKNNHKEEHISDLKVSLDSEKEKIASAIRTDFILSAEIMAITLSTVADSPLWLEIVVLLVVGIGMTFLVYGAVAIIVKADDFGLALTTSGSVILKSCGLAIVRGMPIVLQALSTVGMLAMLWVGGGIIIHGLVEFGIQEPEHLIKNISQYAANLIPSASSFVTWFVTAFFAAIVGLFVGGIAACFWGQLNRTRKVKVS